MLTKLQGVFADKLFHGLSSDQTIKKVYGESADLFSKIIKENFDSNAKYKILDLGSHKGEFLYDLLEKLELYDFETTAVEINTEDLENNFAQNKVNSDLKDIPLEDKSFDITLCRYALAWNSLEDQEKIIQNIKRLTRGIAIIQHQGSKDDSELLKNASQKLFDGRVELLKRDDFYFSSPNELESILKKLNIEYKIVQNRTVEGLSKIFIKKYSLNDKDKEIVKEILKDCDYVNQTTFILDFRNSLK